MLGQIYSLVRREIQTLRWVMGAAAKGGPGPPTLTHMYLVGKRIFAADGVVLFSAPAPEAFQSDEFSLSSLQVLTGVGKYTGILVEPEIKEHEHRFIDNVLKLPSQLGEQVCAFAINPKYLSQALAMPTNEHYGVTIRVWRKQPDGVDCAISVEANSVYKTQYRIEANEPEPSIAIVMGMVTEVANLQPTVLTLATYEKKELEDGTNESVSTRPASAK